MKTRGLFSPNGFLLGGLISSITVGVLCDWLGRKKMIVAVSAMFLLAIPVVGLALDSFPFLFTGLLTLVAFFFISETKGKTLDEVEHLFAVTRKGVSE